MALHVHCWGGVPQVSDRDASDFSFHNSTGAKFGWTHLARFGENYCSYTSLVSGVTRICITNFRDETKIPPWLICQVISKHANRLKLGGWRGFHFAQNDSKFPLSNVCPVHDNISLRLQLSAHLPFTERFANWNSKSFLWGVQLTTQVYRSLWISSSLWRLFVYMPY